MKSKFSFTIFFELFPLEGLLLWFLWLFLTCSLVLFNLWRFILGNIFLYPRQFTINFATINNFFRFWLLKQLSEFFYFKVINFKPKRFILTSVKTIWQLKVIVIGRIRCCFLNTLEIIW